MGRGSEWKGRAGSPETVPIHSKGSWLPFVGGEPLNKSFDYFCCSQVINILPQVWRARHLNWRSALKEISQTG